MVKPKIIGEMHSSSGELIRIVDSKFSLDQLDEAFARATDHSVLRAAIVP